MRRKILARLVPFAFALQFAVLGVQAQARPQENFAASDESIPGESAVSASMTPNAVTLPAVSTTLRVEGDPMNLSGALAPEAKITQQELLSAAGTYGDLVRYLQVLPGVVWKSDLSNDLIVRGGHPLENLFVVDGVEVPRSITSRSPDRMAVLHR